MTGRKLADVGAWLLSRMRKKQGQWFAYALVTERLDRPDLRFLRVGHGCTYQRAPHRYPAPVNANLGYLLLGWVDLDAGVVRAIRRR